MSGIRTSQQLTLLLFCFVAGCSGNGPGPLKPQGYASESVLTIDRGDLRGIFVDNSPIAPAHRQGYNGIAQLYHTRQDSGIFVPAYAGFNLEHIFGGDSLHQLFEPRRHPMTLYRKTDDEVLLHQEPTPLSGVESLTSFKVVAPHYVDVLFQCELHDETFFNHGYAGFFWASYIHQPDDKKIYFMGTSGAGGEEPSWQTGWSHTHGVASTHRGTADDHSFHFAANFNAKLASNFSRQRFSEPFFFGRYDNMVLAFFFDSSEVIRFAQSPTGGGSGNPAWDFQYLIPDPETAKRYSFRARVMYKPFVSNDDVRSEFEKWKSGLTAP